MTNKDGAAMSVRMISIIEREANQNTFKAKCIK